MVEPGIVGDVDLANNICTIPDVDKEATPTFEEDENMKEEDEGDSDVSIEPHLAPEEAEVSDVLIVTVAKEQEEKATPQKRQAVPRQ